MTPDIHHQNKALIQKFRQASYNFDETNVRLALAELCADQAVFHLSHPFGDMIGVDAFYEQAYGPLFKAWPDLERRDWIVVAGRDDHEMDWIGLGGYYTGVFTAPWLEIPPTGHVAHMRYHEFFRCLEGKVVDYQAVWDVPEVMMQARAWPMAPSLGREWHVPSPATNDGICEGPSDAAWAERSKSLVIEMLEHLKLHPNTPDPKVMEMERFWHPRMVWYGPAGIGTARGISGFRNWHQIPFLKAMPDRKFERDQIRYHFFGDRNYAAVTGWPNMVQSITHDGWMGIAPSGQEIALRSLDFWRIEDGRIRENWVMVDLLDIYRQLGVDVFARLEEFNKARPLGPITLPSGMEPIA